MEWLEQNIDAYRIVSEILGQLRIAIREGLERVYGEEWYRKGLPEEVFERLVAAKEREKSIDWYEGQYQQIMDYATFPDLIQILEKNSEHFPGFVALAPSPALLHARFLELDVMRSKLGRARPISETELSFLGTFHLRFRKAIEETSAHVASIQSAPEKKKPVQAAAKSESVEATPDPPDPKPEPAASPAGMDEPTRPQRNARGAAKPEPAVETASPDKPRVTDEDDIPTKEIPSIPALSEDPPESVDDEASEVETRAAARAEHDSDFADEGDNRKTKLSTALENNDHGAVLRELYREVTRVAEGVWSNEVTPASLIWDQVTASDWYEVNFSRLGLQPLSVFYEVTSKVDEKVRDGADRAQLQEYLKETNFAKTLLQLRDMFQANNI